MNKTFVVFGFSILLIVGIAELAREAFGGSDDLLAGIQLNACNFYSKGSPRGKYSPQTSSTSLFRVNDDTHKLRMDFNLASTFESGTWETHIYFQGVRTNSSSRLVCDEEVECPLRPGRYKLGLDFNMTLPKNYKKLESRQIENVRNRMNSFYERTVNFRGDFSLNASQTVGGLLLDSLKQAHLPLSFVTVGNGLGKQVVFLADLLREVDPDLRVRAFENAAAARPGAAPTLLRPEPLSDIVSQTGLTETVQINEGEPHEFAFEDGLPIGLLLLAKSSSYNTIASQFHRFEGNMAEGSILALTGFAKNEQVPAEFTTFVRDLTRSRPEWKRVPSSSELVLFRKSTETAGIDKEAWEIKTCLVDTDGIPHVCVQHSLSH